MTCTLTVEQIEVKTDIKVLGVQVDSKLKWGSTYKQRSR